jgi:hypothetical protein
MNDLPMLLHIIQYPSNHVLHKNNRDNENSINQVFLQFSVFKICGEKLW